jgi:ketosteroid isomerase-like protein
MQARRTITMAAREPQELHRLFVKAFNAGDLEGLLALYEPEAVLATAAGPARGSAGLREAYRGFLEPGAAIRLETLGVLECGDLALLQGRWVLEGTERAPARREGRNTEVARRQQNGDWLLLIDVPNPPGS